MTNLCEEYTAKIHLELNELNAKVDAMEGRALQAQDDVRDKYRSELVKLHHHATVADGKLEMLKTSSEDAWDKMVQEMNKVRTAFTQSVNYFNSQF